MESGIDLDEYNATSSHQNIMYKGHIIETCYMEGSCSMWPWSAFTRGIGTINEESREDAIRVMKSKIDGLS
tara:strand:+ start:218 stop:430 length:213 start_codon:yes stop_codon:yes gene_type:complete